METNQEDSRITAKPTPELGLVMDFNINSRINGSSQAQLLSYALRQYRDLQLKSCIKNIADNDLRAAYDDYADYCLVDAMLDDLLSNAIDLAEENFWKGTDRYPENPDISNAEKERRFQSFLSEFDLSAPKPQ